MPKQINSTRQLEEAQKKAKARNANPGLSKLAKQSGYKSADAMVEHEKARRAGSVKTVRGAGKPPAGVGTALYATGGKLANHNTNKIDKALGKPKPRGR